MLREEYRFKVFESRVLRQTGGLRKLHNEELSNLHSSSNIITIMKRRRVKWGEAYSTHPIT
jgi:hypothetical protein